MIFNALLISITAVVVPPEEANNAVFAKAIDARLAERYSELGIKPVASTSDEQFVRRVYLDLAGRIPSVEEAESFYTNPNRSRLIDQLLDSPEFSQFLSQAWTTWLVGYTNAFQTDRETFRVWLEDQIHRDVSFKSIVDKILSAEGSTALNGPTNFLARHYADPVSAVCRSFLGVRIECAQCHDHPFDRWTQEDYAHLKRFFEPMNRQVQNGTVTISDSTRDPLAQQRPRFLTGAVPRTGRYRQELALYLTNCKPFARNFANRCWYFLLGQGVVNPPDDFNQENVAADKQLLEQLAQISRDTNFSIREMFRTICLTAAYQRKSAKRDNKLEIELFAARKIKPLLPIQYIDSLWIALDREKNEVQRRNLVRSLVNVRDLNEDYQRLWEYRESVQQLMRNMTFQFRGQIGDKNNLSTIELYQRFLNRRPSKEEEGFCANSNFQDVMFALALGNEFCFNH